MPSTLVTPILSFLGGDVGLSAPRVRPCKDILASLNSPD